MTARRRLLAAASATTALVALTGCEKPAPLVTLVAGGQSVYSEASGYCFEEDQTLAAGGCAEREQAVQRLETREGERIGIDVDKELVDRGWQLEIVDPADPERGVASGRLTDHYLPIQAPGIRQGGRLRLIVRTVSGEQDTPTGEWQFELVNRE
jgi:hypothetical protein